MHTMCLCREAASYGLLYALRLGESCFACMHLFDKAGKPGLTLLLRKTQEERLLGEVRPGGPVVNPARMAAPSASCATLSLI